MLGHTSISAAPISTSFFNPNVTVNVTGSLTISGAANVTPTATPFTLGVGTVTVTAAANVSVTGNALTIGTGSVTITAAANVSPTGVPMTLTVNDPGIITWQPIDPGASQTWVNIDPY